MREHPPEMLGRLPGASGDTGMERNRFVGKKSTS